MRIQWNLNRESSMYGYGVISVQNILLLCILYVACKLYMHITAFYIIREIAIFT